MGKELQRHQKTSQEWSKKDTVSNKWVRRPREARETLGDSRAPETAESQTGHMSASHRG
jgi:hypothetical protein